MNHFEVGRGNTTGRRMIVDSIVGGFPQTPRDKRGKSEYVANVISPDSGASSSGERAPRKPPSGKKRPPNVKSKALNFNDQGTNSAPARAKDWDVPMKTSFGSTRQGSDPPTPKGLISSKHSFPRRIKSSTGDSPKVNVISPASSIGGEVDQDNGVYNSPDPTSKFHKTQGQNDFGNDESCAIVSPSHNGSHVETGFSPMPATPTEQQLIVDLEKKMADAMEGCKVFDSHAAPGPDEGGLESPDVLSRFSKTATLRGGLPQQVLCESPVAASNDEDARGHDFSPMPATPSAPDTGGVSYGGAEASDYSNAPIIYGNGVSMESPDVLSKFNASGRPVEMRVMTPTAPAAEREHDFSPMPDTPTSPAPTMLKPLSSNKGCMPLIVGQGVSIESPDVLSKFSASGRPLMMNVATPNDKSSEREHDFSPMPGTPVTPGAGVQHEGLGGIAVPRANAMPTIYGQGVAVESPDLLSKFNSQKRPVRFMSPVVEGPSEHDFSPMPATPTEYLPEHVPPAQAPVIYGNGVQVDSPDVLSKFNHTAISGPATKMSSVVESAKLEAARATVPVVHRKRFLRNQSYVSTSLDSGVASNARPPESLRPSKQNNAAPKQPQQPVLDLFSETLSPLKENYGNLLQSIQGEIRHSNYESPQKSFGTPKRKASPLVKVSASPAPGVSTFAATMHTRRTPKSRTPPRATATKLDPFADTLSPFKDDYSEVREKVNNEVTPVRRKQDIFADTLSPFKDDYTEIRERVNEIVKREELEKRSAAQAAASAPTFDHDAVKKPAPPPPRRKQAFHSASSPAKPEGPSSGPRASRRGRTFSPTNAAEVVEGGDVQILSFETSIGAGETETTPSFEPGGLQFRRRGRILRESASEPLIRTVPMMSESPSVKPEGNPSPNRGEEDEIMSAINRFESSLEDEYELKPMALLEESDDVDVPSKAHGEEEVIDEEMAVKVKVTYVGSNLPEGESLRKEKRKKRPFFGPFQPNLESLPEDVESVMCFPSWIMPVPRFVKKAFPMQSVQVKVTSSKSYHGDEDGSGDVDSLLGSQELKLVGRIRRRKGSSGSKPEDVDSAERAGDDKEESPLFRDDTYGIWMKSQGTVQVREQNDGESQRQYDDIFVAIETKNNALLKELTREGFSLLDPECRDSIGNTPLMCACSANNRKIVKLLLKHGCDFNAVNKHGNTALHFAAEYQLASTTKYLLKKGASRMIRNSLGVLAGDRVEGAQ